MSATGLVPPTSYRVVVDPLTIFIFVQRLTPLHHSFDEANAYTYAALFFLGGLLVMMVLDRLPMDT